MPEEPALEEMRHLLLHAVVIRDAAYISVAFRLLYSFTPVAGLTRSTDVAGPMGVAIESHILDQAKKGQGETEPAKPHTEVLPVTEVLPAVSGKPSNDRSDGLDCRSRLL